MNMTNIENADSMEENGSLASLESSTLTQSPDNSQFLLRAAVEKAIEDYFQSLGNESAKGLYQLVIKEVELGLFKTVMRYAHGNQSKAAIWLGLARGTLRKRLQDYQIEE